MKTGPEADFPFSKTPADAYRLDPLAFDDKGLYAYHLHIPQAEMMAKASSSDGSPVSFLSVLLYRALHRLDHSIDRPIVAHVQHFPTQTGGLDDRDWLERKDLALLTQEKGQTGPTKGKRDSKPVFQVGVRAVRPLQAALQRPAPRELSF